MIFKTAYETTPCIGYKSGLDKTTEALKIAFINGELIQVEGCTGIYSLIGGSAASNDVPTFAHPLLLSVENNTLVIDSRSYGKMDTVRGVFNIQNKADYEIALNRAKLNYIWLKQRPELLRDISPVPISLFASWISEAVGKRFALNPKEQFNLGILAAVFYNSLFTDDVDLTEHNKLKLVNSVSRALKASTDSVLEIVDANPIINNVFEFCSKAESVTGSIRLRELNPGILYTILGGTWFGTSNAKELVAIAIEHPPTWLSIVMTAFSDRSFRNTQISKITERGSYRNVGDTFTTSVLKLIHTWAVD